MAAAGFVLAIGLSPSLNMLALGDQDGAGAGRVAAENPPARSAGHRAALRRGGLNCRADWFIGLVVPQLIRRLVSVDLRVMVPLSARCGALVLLLADIAARTLFTPGSWQPAS